MLDRIDIRILVTLQAQGRMTNRNLAEQVNLSQSACLDRVRRLENAKYIRGYMAVLEPTVLGDFITVYAQITLSKHGDSHQKAFEDRLLALPEVVECAQVSGACDYLARFVCRTLSVYQDLTATLLDDKSLHVSQIMSHIVMRQTKVFDGIPVEHLTKSDISV